MSPIATADEADPAGAVTPSPRDTPAPHGDGPGGYPTWTLDGATPVRTTADTYTPTPRSDSETQGSIRGTANPPTPRPDIETHHVDGGRGGPVALGSELELAGYRVGMAAEVVDDLERTRIANMNRLAAFRRNLLQPEPVEDEPDHEDNDEDGGRRAPAAVDLDRNHTGSGIEDELIAMVTALVELETQAIKTLERAMKAHPLGVWVKAQRGLGYKQTGRLLAAVGDPYWNARDNHPRTVSALWRYTGFDVIVAPGAADVPGSDEDPGGDPDQRSVAALDTGVGVAPRRRRGQPARWSHAGHMRAILIANSCVKQLDRTCTKTGDQPWADHIEDCRCSPYRKIYDHGRRKYAGCDITEKHKHQRAVRLVAKEILKHLWIEAKHLHGDPFPARGSATPQNGSAGNGSPVAGPGQKTSDPQTSSAGSGQDASATHDSIAGLGQPASVPHVSVAGPGHFTLGTQGDAAGPGQEVSATPKPPAGPGR